MPKKLTKVKKIWSWTWCEKELCDGDDVHLVSDYIKEDNRIGDCVVRVVQGRHSIRVSGVQSNCQPCKRYWTGKTSGEIAAVRLFIYLLRLFIYLVQLIMLLFMKNYLARAIDSDSE